MTTVLFAGITSQPIRSQEARMEAAFGSILPRALQKETKYNFLEYVTELTDTCSISFSDVPPTDPFYDPIHFLACQGIMSGYSDGTFRPYNNETRGGLAKSISFAAGYGETVPQTTQTFADVPNTHPFWLYAERTAARGVMSGYICGGTGEPCDAQNRPYFRPSSNITRGQEAKAISIAVGYSDQIIGQTFADVGSNNPFYNYIERLYKHGVAVGYNCGGAGEPCDAQNRPYFRPNNSITRGQSAKWIYLAFFPSANCSFSLSPTGLNSGSGGTNGFTNISAPNGCNWTASSNAAWITITSGSSGNGNGTVSFSVAANGSSSSRSGTLTVGEQTFTVTQDGATVCNYSISPIYHIFPDSGGTTSVNVTAPAGCPWTVTNSVSWISVSSGASGSGNGTVVLIASPNTSANFLQGVLTIAGNDFSVGLQAAQSFSVTGAVVYGITNQSAKYVSDSSLFISGNTAPSITNINGGYAFNNLTPNGQYTIAPSKSGNVNGITAFDATLVLRCVAAGANCVLTTNQRKAADSDNDNNVTAFDATQILRFVAANGANANTGETGKWKFLPGARDYLPLNSSRSGENYEAILVGEVDGDWAPPANNSLLK